MDLKILPQPDDVTCGPTSLHAVYSYLGYKISLNKLISEIEFLEEGGTLGVFLGIDALKRGFKATIYSYNLKIFDPTWSKLKMPELREKLVALHKAKHAPKLKKAIEAYIRFIDLGGTVATADLRASMFEGYFKNTQTIMTSPSLTISTATRWGISWCFTGLTKKSSSWWLIRTVRTRWQAVLITK